MAERSIRHGFKPDHILCSSAKRTRKTLGFFLKAFGYKKDNVLFTDQLYLAESNTIAGLIRNLPENVERTMIVGHNPGLTDFINAYSHIRLDNLPTCGICCIHFEIGKWAELQPNSGDVLYLEYPRLFSA